MMSANGGPARQLTRHEASDLGPRWSPDGQEIVFYSIRSGNMDIWVIPAVGGEARQITKHPAGEFWPQWSPDGQWLYFTSQRFGGYLWRIPSVGGTPESLKSGPAGDAHGLFTFSSDSQWIYFYKEGNFWAISAVDGSILQVTDFKNKHGNLGPFAFGTDGQRLFFTWEENTGDLWIMDVE
jgi:TolB protein